MDFGWALERMRDGLAVRRGWWEELVRLDPGEYASLRLERPAEGWEEILVAVTGEGRRTMYNPSHAQLLATDWEIC